MGSRVVLARNLRRIRERQGLNQETLADAAGIDRSYLSDLENEKYSASVDILDALAGALSIHPADLIDDRRKGGERAR